MKYVQEKLTQKNTFQMIIKNANIVTLNDTFIGSINFNETILNIDKGNFNNSNAIDFEGDYLLPGFIELHTDNLEKHFIPRPNAIWPTLDFM